MVLFTFNGPTVEPELKLHAGGSVVDKAIYFSWFGPELFCLLLGPPGFNICSSVPVVLFGTPGISGCRSQNVPVESSSLLHHSIYL